MTPGSIAEEMEIEAGDYLLEVNGTTIVDIFDYQLLCMDEFIDVVIEKSNGEQWELEIEKDENGKLIWVCPNCGNKNQDMMSVARRTCGYIGTQFWNQGRTQEIKERVLHL